MKYIYLKNTNKILIMKKNKKKKSLSIFFPAFNEEKNVEKSVKKAIEVAKKITNDYEIIVIDDGSIDNTASIADKLAKNNPKIVVIHHKKNQGYGGALITGIKTAKKDLIFFSDIDLQFNLKELIKFMKYIEKYDAVIGYRNPRKDPFMRLVNAWGWKMLINLLFNLRVKDIDCAFKLFNRKVFDKIKISSKGAMISAEILIRIKQANFTIKELPVKHYPRTAGSPTGAKFSVIVKAFKELIKVHKKIKQENKKK